MVDGDVVWGMEPSTQELEAPLAGTSARGIFQVLTGSNTVRCMGCNQNYQWKDNSAKFLRCVSVCECSCVCACASLSPLLSLSLC